MKKEKKIVSKPHGNFDENAARAIFKNANEFVSNLWKISCTPAAEADGDDGDDEDVLLKSNSKTTHSKFSKSFGKGTRAKSLEELHHKLEELKGKRSYKDNLSKKGLKNRITKKARKEERALKKKLVRTQKTGKEFAAASAEEVKFKPTKPIYNSEGKMVFSKFDFSESTNASTELPEKKITDPKALMHQLEKRNEKMKRLEMSGDAEKVKYVKETYAWKTALQKSEGTKLKDDPILLAKTIKKNTDRKKHSKQKWEARDLAVKKKMETQQKKRNDNIEQRQKSNKLNKMRKSAKKGRVIPGF